MMATSVRLRPVENTDAVDLGNFCWPEITFETIQARINTTTRWSERGRAFGIVAESEGQAIGFGQLTFWNERGEISDLVVAKNRQNAGIGSAILKELLRYAREIRLAFVEIGVNDTNPDARRLYENMGFRDQGFTLEDEAEGLIHFLRLDLTEDAG